MVVIMVVIAIVHGIVYADQDGLAIVAEVVCKSSHDFNNQLSLQTMYLHVSDLVRKVCTVISIKVVLPKA